MACSPLWVALGEHADANPTACQSRAATIDPLGNRTTFGYNVADERVTVKDAMGNVNTSVYDWAGAMVATINPQGYRTTWVHDAADRVRVQYLGNGTRASTTYDDASRVVKLANIRSDSTTISSFDYAYDSVGNRTRVIESDGVRVTWSYDAKYQLTRERRGGTHMYDITYSYDAAGNRRVKLENAITTTYSYNAANELRYTQDNTGRTTYTFDANGNQRIVLSPSGGLTTNTWDYENKLTRVVLPTGIRNTFAYDADGKRVRKDDSGGTTKFVWDGENILVETNASDVIQAVYTLEPQLYGNLISQLRGTATSFYHFDVLGATDRLTDSTQVISVAYLYNGYGVLVMTTGLWNNSLTYVGRLGYQYEPDLDQYYVRTRFLGAAVGHFISRDNDSTDSARLRLYVYCGNDPINYADPSGRRKLKKECAVYCQGFFMFYKDRPWECSKHYQKQVTDACSCIRRVQLFLAGGNFNPPKTQDNCWVQFLKDHSSRDALRSCLDTAYNQACTAIGSRQSPKQTVTCHTCCDPWGGQQVPAHSMCGLVLPWIDIHLCPRFFDMERTGNQFEVCTTFTHEIAHCCAPFQEFHGPDPLKDAERFGRCLCSWCSQSNPPHFPL